ncbi:penicillin-binding protein 2 [Sulfurimonas sp.]|uniref:peptidoglycan D,D-transpeptidase FtsI family protein n=1 Tax=Sulfurimonas sp. TaxID=2022749 RepID=UPI0025FDB287|nr:penicillin-binding protein 2 [Sulfurimonas sp.]MDD5157539.1 penicillin-binding protein 2 [Sulfurimonas sp.]
MINQNKSKKIFLLFSLISFGFIIFLAVMLLTVVKSRDLPSLYSDDGSKAKRGSIISADGFHIATTKKLYKAVVNTNYIDPQKKELFVELFSIYSEIPKNEIIKKIQGKNGVVVLSYDIPEKIAQNLKSLTYELRKYNVFMELKNPRTGKTSLQGLSVIESGESREYSYGNILTPILGYTHKSEDDGYTNINGVKGLEKMFETELTAKQDASTKGYRDVNSYIILNKDSFTKQAINGLDVKLNIPISLQVKVERMLDKMKIDLMAEEAMCVIMSAKDGKVIAMASSNRFIPKAIQRSDYSSLNSGMIEYSFEPGSVIKSVILSLLLDKGAVNPYDMVNGHNGRYAIGSKVITDEHTFDWLSVEDIIIHSSNIGIAQIAQKLSGAEFHDGLMKFGFAQDSTNDLIYEKAGSIPDAQRLNNEIYKATCAYGYGMRANLMQIIQAYSAFNNGGKIVKSRIVNCFVDAYNREIPIEVEPQVQVIKNTTAEKIKGILIKTVNEGTGVLAKTEGLEIGGKTGTAHMVEKSVYVSKYNTTFAGFANDKNNKYMIGVVVMQPKKSQFAAQTSVPIFKKAVDILVEDSYLKPDIIKQPSDANLSLH